MIRPEKLNSAFHALQQILVRARFMAYNNEDHKKIAKLLDDAEYLPRLMAVEEDETEEFRRYLQAIAEEHPLCAHLLEQFDNSSEPQKW